jgi:hypothetical protein
MRRIALIAFVVAAGCVALPASSTARVARGDASATHAYLEAVLAERDETASTGRSQLKAIETLASQVKTECPGILAGAPPRTEGEEVARSTREIDDEVVEATFGAAERVAHPIFAKFARRVEHLRWSNLRLTRLLRSLAREAAVQSGIPAPNLCADLKYWVASDYTRLSQGTVLYAERRRTASSITLIESEPHEPIEDIFNTTALVRHRLKPYEDHRDMLLAHKAFPPQPTLRDPRLKPLFEALGSVYTALGKS